MVVNSDGTIPESGTAVYQLTKYNQEKVVFNQKVARDTVTFNEETQSRPWFSDTSYKDSLVSRVKLDGSNKLVEANLKQILSEKGPILPFHTVVAINSLSCKFN